MALLAASFGAGDTSALKLSKTIPLPGVTGRFDHFALDIKGNRLFVAALGNNTLEAIDLTAAKRIQSIPGLGKPTGILFLPDLNRLFLACGDDGNVRVFDGLTLRFLKTILGLDDADNMRFDAKAGLIYAGYGAGGLAVIDAAKAETIGHFKLAGHPESFQLERNGGRIFVNDDLFYDAAGRCLYASCGEGFIDIIVEKNINRYERAERIPTSPGSRTAYLSPDLKEFYLAVPERGAQKAEIHVFAVK
jgi:hypothetical protein